MAQQTQIGRHKTRVIEEGDTITVYYHDTAVVSVTPDKIILDTGGWWTPTTKTRMNQTSHQFNLGYWVSQKNWEWYIQYNGQVIPYVLPTMKLKRTREDKQE